MVTDEADFAPMQALLERIPGVAYLGSGGSVPDGWWVSLDIDVEHPLAWQVVQQLSHVLNFLAREEDWPTILTPIAPTTIGGPKTSLSWAIDVGPDYPPAECARQLQAVLPDPVEDENEWHKRDAANDDSDEL